jgi:amino acid adenylation domain-containing protein/non-ribosomal peptide synthase protein (TIGR01720 family)
MQHPKSTHYNLPNYIFMPLSVTRERVVRVMQQLVDSFPELHTRFMVGEQGEMRQWCDMSMPIPVVSRQCTEAELQDYIAKGFVRPFDLLGSQPLFRVEVVETEKGVCLLSDGYHGIVDGLSFAPILTTAFATLMEGGRVAPQSYGMYQAAEDEVATFGSPLYQRAKAYYAEKYDGLSMVTLSHAKPGTIGQMGRSEATVSRSVCDDWCRDYGVQPNLLFQAAFGHVMSVLTRQEKVAYSAVNHGRMDKRLRGCVGMFVKTVPMLADADPSQRVIDFVRSQRGELMKTVRYGAYPFTHFCSDLQVKQGVTFNFQAMANMEEHVMVDGVMARAVQPVRNETDSDLSVLIFLKDENYEIRVESSLAMNDADTLQMVAEAMRVAVCNMTAHPELTLGELDIVSAADREALITLGRGKQMDIDPQMTFVKAFEQCASQHPDDLAVADAHDSLTYGELSRRSDVLANRLMACGVHPNDFVAVKLDRTIEFPLAVIAIHKAGAAYVPIDLEYPEDRQQYMLDDCQAKVVVDSRFMAETDFSQPSPSADRSTAAGLAYMIYTSGSTGRPKGAMIRQAGLWNFVNAVIDMERLTANDRISAHRSFSFDAHIEDLFPILCIGGSLHIMPEVIRKDLTAIRNFLFEHQVTGGGYATPVASLLLNTYDDLPVRFITAGGEKLAGVYSDHIEIINVYGPTECTDDTSYFRIPPGSRVASIPIGQTVANCCHFIVDRQLRLVPRGAKGELCFAGVQVGAGYWQQPELTAERFVPCPFLPVGTDGQPVRMYLTGDICRWNADGLLEFIGRQDGQLKLHGYRVELGEIESCASKFEGITQAVAVIRPIGTPHHPQNPQRPQRPQSPQPPQPQQSRSDTLCLYFTASQGTKVDAEALRQFLSRTLADYMLPAVYMQMDTLPLTSNGKVDRRRLPEPKLQQDTVVVPATELEQQLFDIVARQIGTVDFGVTTDLVSLGMSSIDAMRLSMTIDKQTGLRLTVGELLANPTIRHIAETARRQQADSDIDLTDFHREQDSYPLSANQRGVYIDWELNRDTTQYNVPVAICLGQTAPALLADALRLVVDAHSYIKTRLENRDGSVVQLRRDNAPVQVSVTALDFEPDRDFFQQRVRPFNLFTDDLYRLEIYTCGERTWLFRDFHHIVTDGLSDAVFFRDLLVAVDGTQPKKETVTAFDYALYEQQLSSTDRRAEARHYFDHLLDGTEAASYPHTASGTVHRVESVTSAVADSEAIRKACRRMGITPNSYFQTVLAQVLHRLTRQEHMMLATVSSGRSLQQTEGIMGMFVKTLPLVSTMRDGASFATAAQAIHHQSIESMSRDFYPLTEMVEHHGLRPEILYAFEGGLYDDIAASSTLVTDVMGLTLDTPKMPIEVTVTPDRKGIYTILLNFDAALYSHASMAALVSALTTFAAYAAKEDVLLSDIEMVSDEQRAALIALGAGKHIDIDPQMTFVKAFEQCASQHPDDLAVADAHDSLTYGELSHRSDVLANRLMACGVRPNDFVAVKLDRTIEFPLAVIAIHKAGAAYVPIDLEYPEDRQQYMLDDCQAKVVVDSRFMAETDFSQASPSVDRSTAAGLAYMIYTSGSTGRPKGVMIRQRGLSSYIASMVDVLGLTPTDRISLHRPFSFDAHIQDLYPVLTLGGSLHIMPSEIRRDIQGMRAFIASHSITGGSYTTSLGRLLIESGPLPLRYMTLTGERMADLVSGDVQLFNGYGPTECTDLISAYRLERGRCYATIPIGRPMANSHCFIVDAQGRLLPRGAEGELCFASVQVSAGYWHQPELTAEKFRDCPFLPTDDDGQPVRMYRTGDLCRWNEEGQLEFLGRTDDQVKLRGYRIELGEIESCASKFEGITQAVAVIRPIGSPQRPHSPQSPQRPQPSQSLSDTLCLYYTASQGMKVDAEALRRFLSRTLAEYMLPAVYMQIDALPLTPNGKVDRRHLPDPTFTTQTDYVAPVNKAEETIVRLLGGVLAWQKPISMLDNFFTLGGDSIKLIHLVSLLYNEGFTAQVSELMKCSTVRDMASTLVSTGDGHAIAQEPVTGTITPGAFQQRFLSWKLDKPGLFTQSVVLRASQPVNELLLRQALQALAVHHDMLRATIVGSSIVIRPTTDNNLFSLEVTTLPPNIASTALGGLEVETANRQSTLIDLEHGPILRTVLLHADDGDRLLMVCHHIAIDGVSWRILVEDLTTALSQLVQGKIIALPRKTHSFAYWTDTVSRYRDSYLLQTEKSYWLQVQKQMEGMDLTTAVSKQMRQLTATLEGEPLRLLLTQSAKAYNTEVNDLLLTALSQAYQQLTGSSDVTVQMEGHGREPLHEAVVIHRTVGWFTSFYPVIIRNITGDIRHDVRLVKEQLRAVPNKGIGYGILQYVESKEGDTMLRNDLIPLLGFNYLGHADHPDDGESLFTTDSRFLQAGSTSAAELGIPLPSIDINCAIVDGRFVAHFAYDPQRWNDDKAQQLADAFIENLARVAAHTAAVPVTEPTASDFGATGWTEQQWQNVTKHLASRGEKLQRVYSLTPMQQGILITYLSNRDTKAYRLLYRLSLSMLPTEAALRHTLDYLAEKHEVLRTAIFHEGVPQPCQAIVSRQLPLEMRDLTGEADIEAAATAVHQEMLQRKLSLTDDPMFHLVCMKTGADSCQLLVVLHHIVVDGWSIPIIFKDLLTKLDAEASAPTTPTTPTTPTQPTQPTPPTTDSLLPPTTPQSGRYEAFVRQLLRRDRKAALAYWKNLLADYHSRAALPSYGHPKEKAKKPFVRHTIDEALTTQLRQLAARSGVTLNTVMELGWGLVLQSCCRTDDAAFLRVVSGRDSSEGDYSQLVGLFINSVPVRVQTSATDTVVHALKALQRQEAQSAAYDFCPLSEILSQSELGSALFQSVLAFENYPIDHLWTDSTKWEVKPVQMEEEPFGELTIAISPEREGTLRLTFTYDTSLYSETQMLQTADTFETVVRNMAAMPDAQLRELPLITEETKTALVELGRGEQLDFNHKDTLVSLFRRQAALTPDATAVVFGNRQMTYRELDQLTDRLACYLIINNNVQSEEAVGVMIDRSELMVVYPLAIMKAGGCYMPLDFKFPADRLQYMCEDAGVRLILSEGDRVSEAMPGFKGDVVTSDKLTSLPDCTVQLPSPLPQHRYVILYTSGSTGRPKGVVLEQHSIVNFCHWYVQATGISASDRVTMHAAFGFDCHMMEMFPTLMVGATLYVIPSEMRLEIEAMNAYFEQNAITMAFMTTQVGHLFASNVKNHSLRMLCVAGEKLMPLKYPGYRVVNGYGPTEATVLTTYLNIDADYDRPNIGRPLCGYQVYVVDSHMRLVPRGVPGELVICGEGVARGYLHPTETDAAKFYPITNGQYPITNNRDAMAYRTGDLVRWDDDGNLLFLGRTDNQVKLRGLRIELGEIESCASQFEGIGQVAAQIINGQYICLYYTVTADVDDKALKQYLHDRLADYQMPTAYMQLDAMPLNANGKVDRQRLPDVDLSLMHADYVAPESELEKLIVSGFEKVLKQEKISVNDDFVRLGGDSLAALKLAFSLGERGITVADVLSLRTPAAIANNAKHISVNLDKYSIENGCPLNNTQMFIFNDIVKFNKYDSYLMLFAIPIDRKCTDEQIRNALDAMFAAHPVLTMHVAMRDGVPYLEKGEKPAVMKGSLNPLKTLSLLISNFDLYSSLARHVIVRIPGRCYLLSVVHHLIFDLISQNVFCRHFQRALEGASLGGVDDHFLKVSAFHQEVRSTEQYAEMNMYIRSMLSNLSEANFYRNPEKPGRPGFHKRELGVDQEQVNRFTDRFGINKNILFTAAMVVTLSKLTGCDEVAFGFLDNGRDRFNNFEDIGLYINGMPIVAHADHHDMRAFLNRLADIYYKLSQNNFFPFASLVQEFNIAPIILFQFFPDWIVEDGKYEHLPQNEALINAAVSTQKNFMVEALVDVVEKKNHYTIKVMYSGYYSRKMMKKLAKTYKETLSQMLIVES